MPYFKKNDCHLRLRMFLTRFRNLLVSSFLIIHSQQGLSGSHIGRLKIFHASPMSDIQF
jgi:hypothetical protein